MLYVAVALVTLTSITVVSTAPSPSSNVELLMPQVQPKQADTYLCIAQRIDDDHRYVTGFEPKADSHIAHHVLLYGCSDPGNVPGKAWNCGEMSSENSDFAQGSVCSSGQSILYAWAMDAPKLNLPDGVGFDVGQATPIKYLVLQVHYKNVTKFLPPVSGHDNSGLVLKTTKTPTPKLAGVYLMLTGGSIPAHTIEYFESACDYEEDVEIVPFAYRTHAHSLGRVISGYRVREGEWSEIGRKDPRLPEMFYNVTNTGMTIKKGDVLAARCTMENTKDHLVRIGATQQDEMCNFYIMFYVESAKLPETPRCITPGPPFWYWSQFQGQGLLNAAAVPKDASLVPGTTKALERNASNTADVAGSLASNGYLETLDNDLDPYFLHKDRESMVAGLPDLPGEFRDESVASNLDDAIQDMSPEEMMFLVQQLAQEEEIANEREKEWLARQRLFRAREMYPYV